jgi:predicted small lipoprotein YifL
MDDDGLDFWRFRALLAFGIVFAGLFVYSLFDIVFLALGRKGEATVTETYVLNGRRSDSLMMEFEYREPGASEPRKGKINLGSDTSAGPPPGTTFEIQYLPIWLLDSPDAARPKRPFSWLVFSLLLLSGAGCGVFAYGAIYYPDGEARSPARRKR